MLLVRVHPEVFCKRFQRRIEPVHKRLFGGCHVTRDIVDLVSAAGFAVTEVEVFYGKGAPKYGSASSLGVEVAA